MDIAAVRNRTFFVENYSVVRIQDALKAIEDRCRRIQATPRLQTLKNIVAVHAAFINATERAGTLLDDVTFGHMPGDTGMKALLPWLRDVQRVVMDTDAVVRRHIAEAARQIDRLVTSLQSL